MAVEPKTIGRYEVRRELGHGAMGVVYLAFDPLLKRPLAIKTVREFSSDTESTLVRFQREAEISARLNHPNIVTVHDVGSDPQTGPFLAMEYIDGLPLSDLIREGIPIESVVNLLLQGMSALQAAERAGIIHRDIKPANILVSHDGRLKLMDFGIARGEGTRLTQTGQIIGTPSYTAPEALGGAEPSVVTDRYAFAVTAFQMLTRELPFECSTIAATLFRIVHEPPVFPDTISRTERAVFERALAKDPADRYPDLATFMRDLIWSVDLPADTKARFLAGLSRDTGAQVAHLMRTHAEEAPVDRNLDTQVTPSPSHNLTKGFRSLDSGERRRSPEDLATAAFRTPRPGADTRPAAVPPPEPPPEKAGTLILTPPASEPTLVFPAPGAATPSTPAPDPGPSAEASAAATPVPAVSEPGPAEDSLLATPVPAARTPLPAERTPVPAERTPVPAARTPVPAEQTPVPAPEAAPAPDPSSPEEEAQPGPEAAAPPAGARRWILSTAAGLLAAAILVGAAVWGLRPRSFLLDIASTPGGARVLLDGREIGRTDLSGARIPAAGGTLRLELEGFEPQELRVRKGDGPVRAVLAPAPYVVQVVTNPPGAEALLNGVSKGTTPIKDLKVPAGGPQELVLRLKDRMEWVQVLDKANPLPAVIALEPITAAIRIVTSPPGAEAFINGARIGVTPIPKAAVQAGSEQRLVLRLKNYKEWQGVLSPGRALPDPILLVPMIAHFQVRTDPAGGTVFLDGKRVGVAPLADLAVPFQGPHILRITRDGCEEWSATLDPGKPLPDPIVLTQVRRTAGPPTPAPAQVPAKAAAVAAPPKPEPAPRTAAPTQDEARSHSEGKH